MNLKKIFAATAFAAAVTTAFAVSAFADATMTASYADGVVTLTDAPTLNPATLLVLDTNNGVALTNVEAANIKQIDEVDEAHQYSSVIVGELAEGTYEVRIGGDGSLTTAMFTVGGGDSPYADPTRLLGDVNNDEYIDMMDAGEVIKGFLTTGYLKGDDLQAGDANDDQYVDMMDTGVIIQYFLKPADSEIGTKTLADKTAPVAD